jgi:hypothetical protein
LARISGVCKSIVQFFGLVLLKHLLYALQLLRSFQAMGVEIEGPINGNVTIHGVGLDGLTAPKDPLLI